MKLKKYIFIFICACLLFGTVKMCEADDYTLANIQEKKDIEKLEHMQDQSDSLLIEVLHDIQQREDNYNLELDSLNNMVKGGNLSSDEINRLNKEMRRVEGLLEEEKLKKDTVVLAVDPIELDSLVYNIVERDSIIWNIVERDSIVYNIIRKDSVVKGIVYKIDTLYYDSDEIKKIKLRKG